MLRPPIGLVSDASIHTSIDAGIVSGIVGAPYSLYTNGTDSLSC